MSEKEKVKGVDCPVCSGNSDVLLTLPKFNRKDRIRKCTNCKHKFHTMELVPSRCTNCRIQDKLKCVKTENIGGIVVRKKRCLTCFKRYKTREVILKIVSPSKTHPMKMFSESKSIL